VKHPSNNRELFLFMRDKLLAQYATHRNHAMCGKNDPRVVRFYREHAPGTKACPVGHLISPAIYNSVRLNPWTGQEAKVSKIIEGESVLSPPVQELLLEILGWIPNWVMMHDVQLVHDNFPPNRWEKRLQILDGIYFPKGPPT
jgi:hypothetical protein